MKRNAGPFYTAWGPGKFCIQDALWCNLMLIRGIKNGTEHKAFKMCAAVEHFRLTASLSADIYDTSFRGQILPKSEHTRV